MRPLVSFAREIAGARSLVDAGLAGVRWSAESWEALLPDDGGAFQELANKIQAFSLFRRSGRQPIGRGGLAEALARFSCRDAYDALWLREGLGYFQAEEAWAAGAPAGLLHRSGSLPVDAMIPLHTGMGLSFATRLLAAAQPATSACRLGEALDRFAALCDESSLPGFAGAAREALGLVVRNLHPFLLRPIDRLLRAGDTASAAAFWHGVGRGLYFSPTQAFPCRAARSWAVQKAASEPPDELGRSNAAAGLVWALTLVNLRQPRILASFLDDQAGNLPAVSLLHGVTSAVLVWFDAGGRDSHLDAFLAYRPACRRAAEDWRRWVTEPCELAMAEHPDRRREGRLQDLFRIFPQGADRGAA